MFYDTLMEKRAGLDKSAFKYNRDMLGALGGGVIGGGLGYASSTDGKNNTRDNRLKRTLIGAGLGGGVGLGFGRMSRKLKDARGTIGDKNQALVNMQGGHKQELSDLESRLKQGHQKSTEALLGHHEDELGGYRDRLSKANAENSKLRIEGAADRTRHHELGDKFRDLHSSHAAEVEGLERQLRGSETRHKLIGETGANLEHWGVPEHKRPSTPEGLHALGEEIAGKRRDRGLWQLAPQNEKDRFPEEQVLSYAKKNRKPVVVAPHIGRGGLYGEHYKDRNPHLPTQPLSVHQKRVKLQARDDAADRLDFMRDMRSKHIEGPKAHLEDMKAEGRYMPHDERVAFGKKHGLVGDPSRDHFPEIDALGEHQDIVDGNNWYNSAAADRSVASGEKKFKRRLDNRREAKRSKIPFDPSLVKQSMLGSSFYSALLEKRAGRYAGLSGKFIEGPTGRYILGGALAGGAIGRKSADEDHKTRDMLLGAGIGGLAGAGMSRMHKAYNAHSMKEHGARANVEYKDSFRGPSGKLAPEAGVERVYFQRASKLPEGAMQAFPGKSRPDAWKNTPWDDVDPMARRALLKKKDIISAHFKPDSTDFGLMRERELARGGRNLLLAGGAGLGLRKLRKKREEDS